MPVNAFQEGSGIDILPSASGGLDRGDRLLHCFRRWFRAFPGPQLKRNSLAIGQELDRIVYRHQCRSIESATYLQD